MPHLLATISAHGLGHLAQSAPVLNALRRRLPRLRLTVASTLPEARLRRRIDGDFAIEARALDFGFVMDDAFTVARTASADAYRDLHALWPRRVAETAAWFDRIAPDLLLCNAAYLPLAAAEQVGVPGFAMSSLNWADLFDSIFGGEPWAPPIHDQMLRAYRSAEAFIRLTPGMDMPALGNVVVTGPVATPGRPRHGELRHALAAGASDRVVLVAFGGFDARLPLQRWVGDPHLHWLVPQVWQVAHPRVTPIEALGWDFADLIGSVDAVIGKPGYGTFVEAACCGTPLLYAPRTGWPEQEPLIRWLHANACAREVSGDTLRGDALPAELAALWQQPRLPTVVASGADEIAALLAVWVRQRKTHLSN